MYKLFLGFLNEAQIDPLLGSVLPGTLEGDLCFLLKLTSLMNQVSETLALLGEIPNDIEGLILCLKDIGVNFIM